MSTLNTEVANAFEKIDFADLIDRMVYFVSIRLSGQLNDDEVIDFVFNTILKTLDGTRNWDSSNYPFLNFIFGVLKSEVDNFISKSKRNKKISSIDEIELAFEKSQNSIETQQIRKIVIAELMNLDVTEDELDMFDFWCDGIYKPAEMKDYFDKPINEIYNIKKRLINRISKVQPKIQELL